MTAGAETEGAETDESGSESPATGASAVAGSEPEPGATSGDAIAEAGLETRAGGDEWRRDAEAGLEPEPGATTGDATEGHEAVGESPGTHGGQQAGLETAAPAGLPTGTKRGDGPDRRRRSDSGRHRCRLGRTTRRRNPRTVVARPATAALGLTSRRAGGLHRGGSAPRGLALEVVDRFDVVAVEVADENRVVAGVVLGKDAWRVEDLGPGVESRSVHGVDLVGC